MDLRETMEKFWHDLAGQGDFYNRDGRTDKGDAYRQIAHDLSAALKKIKPPTPPEAREDPGYTFEGLLPSARTPPAPTDEASERGRCEQVADAYVEAYDKGRGNLAEVLLSERAAVRAECQAEIEGLKAENVELIKHLKLAEKVGVDEGLFDLEECGWYTGEEP